WPSATGTTNVRDAFERLNRDADTLRRGVLERWRAEQASEWDAAVPGLFTALVTADPAPDTRAAFTWATATWVTSMIGQHQLARAARATQLLESLDTGGAPSD